MYELYRLLGFMLTVLAFSTFVYIMIGLAQLARGELEGAKSKLQKGLVFLLLLVFLPGLLNLFVPYSGSPPTISEGRVFVAPAVPEYNEPIVPVFQVINLAYTPVTVTVTFEGSVTSTVVNNVVGGVVFQNMVLSPPSSYSSSVFSTVHTGSYVAYADGTLVGRGELYVTGVKVYAEMDRGFISSIVDAAIEFLMKVLSLLKDAINFIWKNLYFVNGFLLVIMITLLPTTEMFGTWFKLYYDAIYLLSLYLLPMLIAYNVAIRAWNRKSKLAEMLLKDIIIIVIWLKAGIPLYNYAASIINDMILTLSYNGIIKAGETIQSFQGFVFTMISFAVFPRIRYMVKFLLVGTLFIYLVITAFALFRYMLIAAILMLFPLFVLLWSLDITRKVVRRAMRTLYVQALFGLIMGIIFEIVYNIDKVFGLGPELKVALPALVMFAPIYMMSFAEQIAASGSLNFRKNFLNRVRKEARPFVRSFRELTAFFAEETAEKMRPSTELPNFGIIEKDKSGGVQEELKPELTTYNIPGTTSPRYEEVGIEDLKSGGTPEAVIHESAVPREPEYTFEAARAKVMEDLSGFVDAIKQRGGELYIVGGAVRDILLGKKPQDIDLATNLTPEEVKQIAAERGYKVIPTGEEYGTVTIIDGKGNSYETTTFRKELYDRETRKPKVTFTDDVIEDLSRRDFTINAIAYDVVNGKLVDPYNGAEDLKRGIIRAVGDPKERFMEDPLRVFRGMRFAATYDFEIDEKTFGAMKDPEVKEALKKVPKERVVMELEKLFKNAEKPSKFFELAKEAGLLEYVAPPLKDTVGVEQPKLWHYGDVWKHTMDALDNADVRDPEVMMAILLHDVGKPHTVKPHPKTGEPMFPNHANKGAEIAKEYLKSMKFSNRFVEDVTKLVKYHEVKYPTNERELANFGRMLADLTDGGKRPEMVDKLFAVRKADAIAHKKAWVSVFLKEIERTKALAEEFLKTKPLNRNQLALKGEDLKAIADKYNADYTIIGKVQNKLLEEVWGGKLQNNKASLRVRAEQLVKSMKASPKEDVVTTKRGKRVVLPSGDKKEQGKREERKAELEKQQAEPSELPPEFPHFGIIPKKKKRIVFEKEEFIDTREE